MVSKRLRTKYAPGCLVVVQLLFEKLSAFSHNCFELGIRLFHFFHIQRAKIQKKMEKYDYILKKMTILMNNLAFSVILPVLEDIRCA